MKYVVVLIAAILLVRIDVLMGLFDKAKEKLSSEPRGVEVTDTIANRETIPLNEDKALQKNKKDIFLALLEDFVTSPVPEIRQRAMSVLKESPSMFSQKLDKDLEAHIFRWRDLLQSNEPEVVHFLHDLMNSLQGENLETVRRFFSLWMDINMEHFIAAYVRAKDPNCNIAVLFGDAIADEEKLNEYYDRQEALKTLLAKEKLDPLHRALATNCLLQLNILVEKLAPAQAALTPEASSQAAPESTEQTETGTTP